MSKAQITLGSLFDGIGGFPYAASFYGITPLWASEILTAAVNVTQRHFPDMEHVGDITRLDGRTLPPVYVLTFGSPCQGLSMAGRRLGLADERSGLFMEAIRIIREMQEATHGEYPKFALWENVPGALSSAGGCDFKAVLQAFTKTEIPMPCSGKWANAGMVRSRGVDLAWCVYDAQYFGTAQRRRRVFLVADFRGRSAGQILFVPKSLQGYFEAGGTPRQGLAAYAESGPGTAGGRIEVLNDQGGASLTVERKEISPTLRSQTHGHPPVVAAGFDLQQITSGANRSTLKPVQPTLCGAGNPHVVTRTLCMATGQANAEIMEDRCPTLIAAHEKPVLAHPLISGTLCASGAGLSRPAGMASETDFCIVSAGFRYKAGSAAGSVGYQEETAPTLVAGQPSGALQAGLTPNRYLVRRLIPVECERLQGYPDDWTLCGADGLPISDTSRYQMLGNSIAVPCVAYIMQGIVLALEKR